MVSKIKTFLGEAKQEFHRINWPTRREAMRMVGIVIVISVVVSIYLGALDYVFTSFIQKLI